MRGSEGERIDFVDEDEGVVVDQGKGERVDYCVE